MKLSELAASKPKAPHILLYGEVGCGKTALALTLGQRAQLLDIDDGFMTGASLKDKHHAARIGVDVVQFPEPQPHLKATQFASVKRHVINSANALAGKRYPFSALIIDSLSSLAESAVAMVMANSSRIQETPEIQHWGMAFSEIKNVLAVVRAMDIVVVLIAHEQVKSIGEGKTKRDTIEIAVQGKNLPSQICRYFDEIWYLDTRPAGGGKLKYTIKTLGDGTVPARSRLGLPDQTEVTDLDLWSLLAKYGYPTPPLAATPATPTAPPTPETPQNDLTPASAKKP